MIPFRLVLQPGESIYEQVVYAAKRAMMAGQMRPGDPFPSVRALSKALKINPNTAHKVQQHLLGEGVLEMRPGVGAVVAKPPNGTRAERSQLLDEELERLVVEAKKMGLDVADVQKAVAQHWAKLNGGKS